MEWPTKGWFILTVAFSKLCAKFSVTHNVTWAFLDCVHSLSFASVLNEGIWNTPRITFECDPASAFARMALLAEDATARTKDVVQLLDEGVVAEILEQVANKDPGLCGQKGLSIGIIDDLLGGVIWELNVFEVGS